MYLFPALALAVIVVFLILVGRQTGSIQTNRKSQKKTWADADSDLFPDGPQTLLGPGDEAAHQNVPVDYATDSVVDSDVSAGHVDYSNSGYSTGGELGTALADAIDGGGSSFGTFDSGSSDFGSSDFGGGSTSDGTSS